MYRYYVCNTAHQRGYHACETKSVSAPLLEGAVLAQLRGCAQHPALLSEVLGRVEEQRRESGGSPLTDPAELQEALRNVEPLWDQLTTPEQERFLRTLVAEVRYDGRSETLNLSSIRLAFTQPIEHALNRTIQRGPGRACCSTTAG
jgi:hypothetical protein